MAPEALSSTGALGRNADTWAMGLMATRALTEYFPFDDVLSVFLPLPIQPFLELY